jgi:hypothetical protein
MADQFMLRSTLVQERSVRRLAGCQAESEWHPVKIFVMLRDDGGRSAW